MSYASIADRLAANSKKARKPHPTLGCPCRLWTGNVNNSGYPRFSVRTPEGKVAKVYAHRTALELKLGRPLPAGFDADHLCLNTLCIEGQHLQAIDAHTNRVTLRIARQQARKAAKH